MTQSRPRGFSIQTRCETVGEFVERYAHRTMAKSIFVHTVDARVVGTECAFAILLANKQPVLAGTCVVLEVFSDANNPFKRPGMKLGINRLGPESEQVFAALEAARDVAPAPQPTPAPQPAPPPQPTPPPPIVRVPAPVPRRTTEPVRVLAMDPATVQAVEPRRTQPMHRLPTVKIPPREAAPRTPRASTPPIVEQASSRHPISRVPTPVVAEGSTETRTPGSAFILPANPLMNLTDASLEGLVECRLFESSLVEPAPQAQQIVAAPPVEPAVEPAVKPAPLERAVERASVV